MLERGRAWNILPDKPVNFPPRTELRGSSAGMEYTLAKRGVLPLPPKGLYILTLKILLL